MAVLAVIGGIDGRVRLGGQVLHDDFGEGTVTRITPKGRITVQFCDLRTCRVCPLNQLKPVSALVFMLLGGEVKGFYVRIGRNLVLVVGSAFKVAVQLEEDFLSHSVCIPFLWLIGSHKVV